MDKSNSKSPKTPQIDGLKYFKPLLPLLRQLHDVGCQRDSAGNRHLHFDDYTLLVLLSIFNPLVRSLRAIQQASQLKSVQKKLGCSRTSLGSLSESIDVFDPQRLQGIAESLSAQIKPVRNIGRDKLGQKLVAVDGTVVRTLKSIIEAAFMADKNGQSHSAWRLHTHFEIDRNIPVRIDVTPGSNSGKNDEKSQLRNGIVPDCCYVMDRWYAQYTLWNEIVRSGSSYVCRIRDNSVLDKVVEEREVGVEASQLGVARDFLVNLGNSKKADGSPDHKVRVVLINVTPHKKTGGRKGGSAGPPSDGVLRIATNLLDVPAEIIADIFRHRWTIETFFRMFKHILGCQHLISTHKSGIEIQAYCAIIACMLISLWTNRKPTLRTFEMISFYMIGMATGEELKSHIEKLQLQKNPEASV